MKLTALLILSLSLAFPAIGQTSGTDVTRFKYEVGTQSITPQPVDTALTGSQHHLPLPFNHSWSGLGNTGLPAILNEYRPARNAFDPFVFEAFDAYGIGDEGLVFYSANSPFSMMNYNSGGASDKNGQTIKALFAKNLKNRGNITVLGNYSNSDGHFGKQNCNSSAIKANYILNRGNYSLVTGFSRISSGFSENGGLESDEQLTISSRSLLLPVNLSGAVANLSIMTLRGFQSGLIKSNRPDSLPAPPGDSAALDSLPQRLEKSGSLRLTHSFSVSYGSRKYSDSKADAAFYQNTFSDTGATNDSLSFLSWSNDLTLLPDTIRLGQFPVVLKGGVSPDLYRYQFEESVRFGFSAGLIGTASWSERFTGLEVTGKWIAAGYPAGDYNLAARYRLTPSRRENGAEINVELFARGCSPDPFIQSYRSNHFRWNNDFSRQHEAGLRTEWNIPKVKASIGANIISTTGRIYFDTAGFPAQQLNRITVLSLRGSKQFTAGVFRSLVTALVQYSTSGEIRLPLFTGSASTYMHHDVRFKKTGGLLEIEYGLDGRYNTRFHGYAYMPATGVFFAGNEKFLGNYPEVNVFAQMKVKRTRVFVAWCQTFAGLMAQQSFSVLHYPGMRPHLKYGLYWHFYD